MTEQELGTIRGPSQRIREIITQTSLAGRGDPYHGDVYVSVSDGQVDTVVASQGNTLLTYCTFTEQNLSEIGVEVEEEQVKAIFNTASFLSYLDFASDGGEVELSLRGNPEDTLASVLEVTGALNTRIMLPTSESILDDVPVPALPNRFDSDNNFEGASGALETTIETNVEQIQRLIEVVDYDPETKLYPITVEETDDEFEFALDIGRESGRNAVWGELSAQSVESESELQNEYHEGFEPVFDTLSGDVTLQTAPGGAPLAVVQERDGATIRHVIANIS
jgi:hypothetical protein